MDLTIISIVIEIFGFIIFKVLPKIFENNFWDENVPKTLEKFNERYEEKINKILKANLIKSSDILEEIINKKIITKTDLSESKKYSAEYLNILGKHEELLIKIKNHIDIEDKITHIEALYSNINDKITYVKNLSYIAIVCIIFIMIISIINIIYPDSIKLNIAVYCAIYTIIACCCIGIINTYFEYKTFINNLVSYKEWILDESKKIKRISDYDGN